MWRTCLLNRDYKEAESLAAPCTTLLLPLRTTTVNTGRAWGPSTDTGTFKTPQYINVAVSNCGDMKRLLRALIPVTQETVSLFECWNNMAGVCDCLLAKYLINRLINVNENLQDVITGCTFTTDVLLIQFS